MRNRLGPRRLIALAAVATALAVSAAVAGAAALGDDGPRPPRATLTEALLGWTTADRPAGVRADLRVATRIVESGGLADGQGLLAGATGQLWLAGDGRARLDLHTVRGDAALTFDGRRLAVYDAPTNTVYAIEGPAGSDVSGAYTTLATALAELARQARITGPEPGTIAGQATYTVRISPQRDAGLLGSLDLSWDAVRGVPLRLEVYAEGRDAPVLSIEATHVEYGAVAERDLAVEPPGDARVIDLAEHLDELQAGAGGTEAQQAALADALPFAVRAPDTLVGLPQTGRRLVAWGHEPAALVSYGRGLGQLAVLEQRATVEAVSATEGGVFDLLPQVAIDRATGWELVTALGTVMRVERDGILYTIAGSVPAVAAEAAVRELVR